MGAVIQMFGRQATTQSAGTKQVGMAEMRERLRREDVMTALRRLLAEADVPGRLTLTIEHTPRDRLVAKANIGGVSHDLTSEYPLDRLDDFAGIVRTALPGWRGVLARRLQMRIAN